MGPELNSMRLTTLDIPPECVLALSGRIGPAQMPELRALLVDAVDRTDGDILIDTHDVTAFDDVVLVALVAARGRAKFRRHRILVLDAVDGLVARSLRRTGLDIRIPVYPDAATAARHLAADRAVRARLTMSRVPASGPEPARGTTPMIHSDRGGIPRAG